MLAIATNSGFPLFVVGLAARYIHKYMIFTICGYYDKSELSTNLKFPTIVANRVYSHYTQLQFFRYLWSILWTGIVHNFYNFSFCGYLKQSALSTILKFLLFVVNPERCIIHSLAVRNFCGYLSAITIHNLTVPQLLWLFEYPNLHHPSQSVKRTTR